MYVYLNKIVRMHKHRSWDNDLRIYYASGGYYLNLNHTVHQNTAYCVWDLLLNAVKYVG